MPSETLEAERRSRYYAKVHLTASIAAAKSRGELRSYAKVLRAASIVALNNGCGPRSFVKAYRIASVAVSKMKRKLRYQMETSRAASIKMSNVRRTLLSKVKRSRAASILSADKTITETTSRYVYRPLNKHRKEIRLLTLEPGHGDQIIRCTLSHVFLDESPISHYETVSYVCGDPGLRSKIMLHDHVTDVLASSEVVLRRMRLPTTQRVLWVDSICIDQENTAERGHQVEIMYEIYVSTSRNLIWLGPDDGHTEQAIVSIKAVLDNMTQAYNGLDNLGSILRDQEAPERFSSTGLSLSNLDQICDSLEPLFSSPWFGRLWVVQEVSLAPTSVCYRGEYEIQILDILRVASSLNYKWYSISEYVAREINNLSQAAEMWCLADKEHGASWRYVEHTSLLDLLDGLRDLKTEDPRDHVFGTLGLWRQLSISAQQDTLLNPDYSLKDCDVFQNATRYAIKETGNLRVLVSVFESDQNFGKWPSWVPVWSSQYDDHDAEATFMRGSHFRSDNGIAMDMIDLADDPSALYVHGLVVDVINKVLPTLNAETTARKWQENLIRMEALPCNNSWIDVPGGNVEAKVASTLSACGVITGNMIDSSEALESYRAYKQRLISYQEFRPGKDELDHTATDQKGLAARFRNYSVVAMDRAMFNTEDGHIGLGPQATKLGDLVVILYGSGYPAVLRPHQEDEDCFFFVGLAYVYGIMDGEAVREYKAKGVEDTLFCIL
jgi:hypothetical protein